MAEGRIPPQNIEAEQAVLGALLTTQDAFDAVQSLLNVEDFYRDSHRIIYEAMLSIHGSNKRIDLVLLTEELSRRGKLDEVGGISYITSLSEHSIATYNTEAHAQIVSDKAHLRKLIDVGNKIVGMSYEESEDAKTIVEDAERMVLSITGQTRGETSFTPMSEAVLESLERIAQIQENKGQLTGIPTGFKDLDSILHGLHKSDLLLIAARPAMGKTAFTLNLGVNAAVKSGKKVAIFSLEMPNTQLVMRMLSIISSVPMEKMQTGDFTHGELDRIYEASECLSKAEIYIDDMPNITPQEMRSKLRRLKVEKGLDLILIDYIQLMQGAKAGRGADNRQQEISDISRSLKLLAREMDVPVIALSQLSRAVENRQDKRPLLSDLRESGSLEQDADIVMFLHRDYYNEESPEQQNITEVLIRKHRNGSLGRVQLLFKTETQRFHDVETRYDME